MQPDTLLRGLLHTPVHQLNLARYPVVEVHHVLDARKLAILMTQIATTPSACAQQAALTARLREARLLEPDQVVVGLARSLRRIFITSQR